MAEFEFEGRRVHYSETGDGAPLVFLHGLGSSSGQAMGTLGSLERRRVVAWDAPSHGRSETARELHSFGAMGAAVVGLLDHLGVERVVLGGISMGAGLALNVALRAPARVAGLLVVRPAWVGEPNPTHLAIVGRVGRDIADSGIAAARAALDRDPWFVELRATNPRCAASLAGILDQPWTPDKARVLVDMVASAPFGSLDDLRAIGCPATVLASEGDPLHPVAIATAIAGALDDGAYALTPPRYSSPEAHAGAVRAAAEALARRCEGS